MSETGKHTAGEWRLNSQSDYRGWMVFPPDGDAIAMVYKKKTRGGANARLIAAAPDLLTALQACEADYAENDSENPNLPQVRAAIKKATFA